MRNKITDLNNHLFAQLERLGNEELDRDELDKEIDRSKALADIAGNIVDNNRTMIDAMKMIQKEGNYITEETKKLLE